MALFTKIRHGPTCDDALGFTSNSFEFRRDVQEFKNTPAPRCAQSTRISRRLLLPRGPFAVMYSATQLSTSIRRQRRPACVAVARRGADDRSLWSAGLQLAATPRPTGADDFVRPAETRPPAASSRRLTARRLDVSVPRPARHLHGVAFNGLRGAAPSPGPRAFVKNAIAPGSGCAHGRSMYGCV